MLVMNKMFAGLTVAECMGNLGLQMDGEYSVDDYWTQKKFLALKKGVGIKDAREAYGALGIIAGCFARNAMLISLE